MTSMASRSIALLLATSIGGVAALACAQRVRDLGYHVEDAPWGSSSRPLTSCGPEVLVASGGDAVFASRDGLQWQRDVLADDLNIVEAFCVDGVTWGVGYPGLIARRGADASWIVEHTIPTQETWIRRASIGLLYRDPGTDRLRAYGMTYDIDGENEPIGLMRTAQGLWLPVLGFAQMSSEARWAAVARQPFPPTSRRAACRARPRRGRPSRDSHLERAVLCRAGRLLLWTGGSQRRPDSVVRLPHRMRRRYGWIVIGTGGDSVYLLGEARGDGIRGELEPEGHYPEDWQHEENRHYAFARYRSGRWEMATAEDVEIAPAVLRLGGATFLIGAGHIYRLEESP